MSITTEPTPITVERPEDFDPEFDTLTTITYRWRDSDNNKNEDEYTVQGAITDEQAQAIVEACTFNGYHHVFRTDDVDFEHLAEGWEVRSHDPKTHELVGFEVTSYARYPDTRTITEVVEAFQAAAKKQARRDARKARA